MIRPYYAVILDSFHAAFASRILWIAFLAIWILLACLAPIGFREDFTTSFRIRDFENGTRLKAMLASSLADAKSQSPAVSQIVTATPADLKRQLERVGQGDEVRIHLQVLADALNGLLDTNDWYDADAWQGTQRLRERRELEALPPRELTDSQRRRLARLRIEAALPGVFSSRSARSVLLTYAGFDFPASFAIDKTQFLTLVNQWVVPTIINWLLGFVLIFLGILVTASIVPDMLEPGSLHLLLSKPVSRTGLLLSKFVGGCVFVFLCVTQLVVGLWLISGFRLEVWNVRMLWCIPVSVFLFAVFFSVSVAAGLLWRSSILAIGITCMFGAMCLTIGIIGGLFDTLVSGPTRIRDLAVVDDFLLAATSGGGLVRFDATTNRFIEIFESDVFSGDRVLAPVAMPTDDPNTSSFLTAQVRGGRFNPFGSGSLDLLLISSRNNWEPVPSLRLPTGTLRIDLLPPDRLLATNAGGLAVTTLKEVQRSAGEPTEPAAGSQPTDPNSSGTSSPDWIAKLAGMMGGATTGFQSILPRGIALTPPRRIAFSPEGTAIYVTGGGRLYRVAPVDPSQNSLWQITSEIELEGEISAPVVLACSDSILLVARENEPLYLRDSKTLEVMRTLSTDTGVAPLRAVSLGRDDSFAVLASDARCRIINGTASESDTPGASWQSSYTLPIREIEAIHFDAVTKRLIVAHHVDQIDFLEMQRDEVLAPAITTVRRIRTSLSSWRLVDRYVMSPLRMIIPQTGELGETVAAIVSGESSVAIDSGGIGDEPEIVRYRILRPVLSCAGFIVVMLCVSCVYFSTRDY